MTRCCALTGKRTSFGHNVSHANNKTKRRFLPNLQRVSLYSDSLVRVLRLRITTHALRCIEQKGGIDKYLLMTSERYLSRKAIRYKHLIRRRTCQRQETPSSVPEDALRGKPPQTA